MYRIFINLSLAALLIGVNVPSWAGDDEEDANNDWITQCMQDSKREGQAVETVMVYCHCMNSLMSKDETQSITEWEKTHVSEAEACGEKAGWK